MNKIRLFLTSVALVAVGILLPSTILANEITSCGDTFANLKDAVENGDQPIITICASTTLDVWSEILIERKVEIKCATNTQHSCVLDGGEKSPMFSISTVGDLTIQSLTMQNAHDDHGSVIYNEAVLTVRGCTFRNNVSGYHGGAIYSAKGTLATIEDSSFLENMAYNGGAIYSEAKLLQVDHCLFDKNQSYNRGGALYNSAGHANISNSHFLNNVEHNMAALASQVDAGANVKPAFNATAFRDEITRS